MNGLETQVRALLVEFELEESMKELASDPKFISEFRKCPRLIEPLIEPVISNMSVESRESTKGLIRFIWEQYFQMLDRDPEFMRTMLYYGFRRQYAPQEELKRTIDASIKEMRSSGVNDDLLEGCERAKGLIMPLAEKYQTLKAKFAERVRDTPLGQLNVGEVFYEVFREVFPSRRAYEEFLTAKERAFSEFLHGIQKAIPSDSGVVVPLNNFFDFLKAFFRSYNERMAMKIYGNNSIQ